jgi:hypothetical protein
VATDASEQMVPQVGIETGGQRMNDETDSMTEAVRAAGKAAAVETARAQVKRLAQEPMNVRLAAIDLAQRAAAGKQWTPEQYISATEFYFGFLTADTPKSE